MKTVLDSRLAIDGGTPVRSSLLPYHLAEIGEEEIQAAVRVMRSGQMVGQGPVSKEFQKRVQEILKVPFALYANSCTSAFQIGLIACDVKPGDEIIMPSYAFVSMANAMWLMGVRPVFVEVDETTLNVDLDAVEKAITPRTRGVMPVHYAGQSCDLERLSEVCRKHKIELYEDAAQGLGADFKGKPLGTWGRFGAISLHNTKNFVTGEGGLFLTSDAELARRAEIVIEKGTDRSAFLRGEVDKYTWIDRGASFVQSDLLAAIGIEQLKKMEAITAKRTALAERILAGLAETARSGKIRLQEIRAGCRTNWHILYILVAPEKRDRFLAALKAEGVHGLAHYVPLHSAPFARKTWGCRPEDLPATERLAASIVRLPLHTRMSEDDADDVVRAVRKVAARI